MAVHAIRCIPIRAGLLESSPDGMKLDIVSVVGARPNFMKAAPVYQALSRLPDVNPMIVHTGQHYDRAMSDVFFEELGLPAPFAHLGVGSGSHAEQTGAIMIAFERLVAEHRPALVAVYGDVNSTLACALVCAKAGIPLAHVEAGLRSFDREMPEEVNRVVTDHLAGSLLVTEPSGRRNLVREGIAEASIVDTGNAMIDSLAAQLRRDGIRERPHRGRPPKVLVTLHRPSNVDEPARLAALAAFLGSLSSEAEVIFPVHPRTRQRIAGHIGDSLSGRVKMLEPLGYVDFVHMMLESSLIVTDSGGIQEESAYLGIPCLTLRSTTERPITVEAGTNILEPDCRGDLLGAARKLMGGNYPPIGQNPVLLAAGWDGKAGSRIAEALRATAAEPGSPLTDSRTG